MTYYRHIMRFVDNATALTAHAECQTAAGYPSGATTRDRPVPAGTDLVRFLSKDSQAIGATFAAGTPHVEKIADGGSVSATLDGPTLPATATPFIFDIIVGLGQSNGYYGTALSAGVDDVVSQSVLQWGQDCGAAYMGAEPLDVEGGSVAGRVGHIATFARDTYVGTHLASGRKVMLVPCNLTGTGFDSGHWNTTGTLLAKAMARVRAVIAMFPGSVVVASAWSIGEADSQVPITGAAFTAHAVASVAKFRAEFGTHPTIFTGMAPDFIGVNADRIEIQAAIDALPSSITSCDVIDTTDLGSDGDGDATHFSRGSQIAIAGRFATAYAGLL